MNFCAITLLLISAVQTPINQNDTFEILMELNEGVFSVDHKFEGHLALDQSGHIEMQGWLFEEKDNVDGNRFQLFISNLEGNARKICMNKGIVLTITCAPGANLVGHTSEGDFEISLRTLRKRDGTSVLDNKIKFRPVIRSEKIPGNDYDRDFPSIIVTESGDTHVAYIAYDGKHDHLYLQSRIDDSWQAPREVSSVGGDYFDIRLAIDGKNRLWAIWSASDGTQWDLWARYLTGSSWSKPLRLTRSPRNDFWIRAVKDSHGQIWITWQSVGKNLHYEIHLALLTTNGIEKITNVSSHPADDWEPAVSASNNGLVAVAWDTYRNGSFDVYMRLYKNGVSVSKAIPVAATNRREAHADITFDGNNRIWIAWDVGPPLWGKKNHNKLHLSRYIDLACYRNGKFFRPSPRLKRAIKAPIFQIAEYPKVIIDGKNNLRIMFRSANTPLFIPVAGTKYGQKHTMWHLFETTWRWAGWSEPALILHSEGRQDARPAFAVNSAGNVEVVFMGDSRKRDFPVVPLDHNIFIGMLPVVRSSPPIILERARDLGVVSPIERDPEFTPLPRIWKTKAGTFTRLLGDTHRHTDISQCDNRHDGSLQDAYRYALSAANMDFLAITDHDQDLMRTRQGYRRLRQSNVIWWRSQKFCDLFNIADRFIAIYGYEHGGTYAARGGHKNVLYANRGLPVHTCDPPERLFRELRGKKAIVIPHQLADGVAKTDWSNWNEHFEPIVEVFQARGSYECEGCWRMARGRPEKGFFLRDALSKGIKVGVIASSDHGLVQSARAGVFVENFTRDGILDAFHAKRVFGTTIPADIRIGMGSALMGQETISLPGTPLVVEIESIYSIEKVSVIREGKLVHSMAPHSKRVKFNFIDKDLKPGDSTYYYVTAKMSGENMLWSSPIWITCKEHS